MSIYIKDLNNYDIEEQKIIHKLDLETIFPLLFQWITVYPLMT